MSGTWMIVGCRVSHSPEGHLRIEYAVRFPSGSEVAKKVYGPDGWQEFDRDNADRAHYKGLFRTIEASYLALVEEAISISTRTGKEIGALLELIQSYRQYVISKPNTEQRVQWIAGRKRAIRPVLGGRSDGELLELLERYAVMDDAELQELAVLGKIIPVQQEAL
jgi:hypothetical protein